MSERFEVIVVGGGQSGLVAGYYLQRAGIPLREVLSLAEEAGRRTLRIVPDPLAEAVPPEHPHPHDHDDLA